ncbi:MAG: signal recognition particle receptor subunit alpha, partial [Bacteroidales bacterium]|nr:signal recognition particle receptor subunit alpha [Bacteroidales bacterium]
MAFFGLFGKEKKEKLDQGLEKTRTTVFDKLNRVIFSKSKVDSEVLDELEEVLLTSDVGVETTMRIIERIEKRVKDEKYVGTEELNELLRDTIASLLEENNADSLHDESIFEKSKPYVIMVVGVNGVGKTTTIGKLANKFKQAGKTVYIGAADTFRAAAI